MYNTRRYIGVGFGVLEFYDVQHKEVHIKSEFWSSPESLPVGSQLEHPAHFTNHKSYSQFIDIIDKGNI